MTVKDPHHPIPTIADPLATLRHENELLRMAIREREVIEQAKGILVLRYGIDPGRASVVLERWCNDAEVELHTLCETLVHAIGHGETNSRFDATLIRWLEVALRQPPEGV